MRLLGSGLLIILMASLSGHAVASYGVVSRAADAGVGSSREISWVRSGRGQRPGGDGAVREAWLAPDPKVLRETDFLVWDPTPDTSSGPVIAASLRGAGYDGVYTADITPYLGNLPDFRAIFISLGVYPNAFLLADSERVDSLVSYLINYDSTGIYMEGGETWVFDPQTALHPHFNIEPIDDGWGDAQLISGQAGTFTQGMAFTYGGENQYMDRIGPIGAAFAVFENGPDTIYCNGVAFEESTGLYKSVGISFEFAGLTDGVPPSTKAVLADSIMRFFGVAPTTYEWDVAVSSILSPGLIVVPNSPVIPRARVTNLGDSTATFFPVWCRIDSLAQNIYLQSVQVDTLLPDSLEEIEFPSWTPDGTGNVYDIIIYTCLAADQRTSNDTMSLQTFIFDTTRIIVCNPTQTPPAIDGVIDSTEWQSAAVRDVSDIFNMGGSGPFPPGSAHLYMMHDAVNLYLAADGLADTTADNWDVFDSAWDDNHDGSWPNYPDFSEGELWFEEYSTGDTISFQPWTNDSGSQMPYVTGLDGVVSLASGNAQYELALPFGVVSEGLNNVSPGDTVGLWLFLGDMSTGDIYGWWPTAASSWADPSDMGDVVIGEEPGRAELSNDQVPMTNYQLYQNFPNPFGAGGTTIRFKVQNAKCEISLNVYDLSGRLVRTLVADKRRPGLHTVFWDGRDSSGRQVANGVYFYRLKARHTCQKDGGQAGEPESLKKMVSIK